MRAEPSNAFWMWSQKLSELIFLASEAEPATASMTTKNGWRDAFNRDVKETGDMALDAAPDDVTRNHVVRSRSLALKLVRMLHECPDVNSTSCRNWSQVDRHVVEQLAELQAVFAKFVDGALPTPPTSGAAKTPTAAKTFPTQPRRSKSPRHPKRLTTRQTEALKHHGDCESNIAEVARRMGIDNSTARQHVKEAFKKLGRSVPTKAKTTSQKTDRRGQADITKGDDHRG